MEIDIQALKDEIEIWAMASGQERVAIEVSRMYFQLNSGGKPRLSQIEDKAGQADWKAINNNRQQIFRWLRGDSKAAKQKFCDLIPAIMAVLPAEQKAKIDGNRINYLASIAIKQFAAAMSETLLGGHDISRQITNAVTALNAIQYRA
ncbi:MULTISPECIES: toxin YdaT family protein [Arsenophonus]|uniref:toxin YdaT family protein n=1 Tax=Arsenophonus TaxID=637 RepID=UPI0015D6EDDA|nr:MULTISPECIES: toxin YdaT family protein [Arsenophonus]UBX30280.1 toxin YdaT domain-containing protein [Arsenophonus apicola]